MSEAKVDGMENLPAGANSDHNTDGITSNADGSVEFRFDASEAVTGLVIRESDNAE